MYLHELVLSENKLGKQLSGAVLRYLTSLTKLDLLFNYLTSLPPKVYDIQFHLRILNLSNNNLQLFNVKVDHMIDLSDLDLSSNLFVQISNIAMLSTQITNVREGGIFNLNLSSNVLACSCDTRNFLEWIIETPIQVTNWHNYTCMYHHKLISLNILKSVIIPSVNIECRSKTLLITSIASLCFIAFLLALSLVLYRHRFEVKYILLEAHLGA